MKPFILTLLFCLFVAFGFSQGGQKGETTLDAIDNNVAFTDGKGGDSGGVLVAYDGKGDGGGPFVADGHGCGGDAGGGIVAYADGHGGGDGGGPIVA